MNKVVKTVVVLLAGLTLTTGTALAAPRHGGHGRPVCIHHAPTPPRPQHHRTVVVHHHANGGGLVAGLVGGLIGGIVGALVN